MLIVLCYLGLVSTVYMTGVVWFAQLVHYPLLGRGIGDDFVQFAHEYQRRTFWVVFPGLAGEIISAMGLVWSFPSQQTWIGLGLLVFIWVLTLTLQIPQHLALKKSYDEVIHRNLVRWNLPRAIAWTLRSAVMVWTSLTLL